MRKMGQTDEEIENAIWLLLIANIQEDPQLP